MTRHRPRAAPPYHPAGIPALVAVATAAGLLAGLLGEGRWDDLAAAGLAVPVAAILAGIVKSWRLVPAERRPRQAIGSGAAMAGGRALARFDTGRRQRRGSTMSEDKQPMQSDGSGTSGNTGANPGTEGPGESGGGAYPNPQSGKAPQSGFMGHGGQTELTEKEPGKLPD